MHIPNPWLSLSAQPFIIAQCDLSEINKLDPLDKSKVFFDLYPEPFVGDPDANVYLLNGNPGYSDQDNCFAYPSIMSTIMTDVYSHDNKAFFWNDLNNPLKVTCPRTGRAIIHQGHIYWQKRLYELTKEKGRIPRLFELEFYPYHSKVFYGFMKKPLPSFEYSRHLVLEAMKKNKTVIFLRHKTEWENAIPELKQYNTFSLTSPRSTYLTHSNMSHEAWLALIRDC